MIGKIHHFSSFLSVMRWLRKVGREPIVCLNSDIFPLLFYKRGGSSVGGDLGCCSSIEGVAVGRGLLLPKSNNFYISSLIFRRYSTGMALGMVAGGLCMDTYG
jgi:hypothetical protein